MKKESKGFGPKSISLISWPIMAFLIIACTGTIAQLSAASEPAVTYPLRIFLEIFILAIPSHIIYQCRPKEWNMKRR